MFCIQNFLYDLMYIEDVAFITLFLNSLVSQRMFIRMIVSL